MLHEEREAMKKGRLHTLVGGILGAAGTVFVCIAAVMTAGTAGFLSGAERTEGVVVDVVERRSTRINSDSRSRRTTSLYPVVEFTAPDGNPVTFESDVGSDRPGHQVGDRVEVAFDPDDPADARLTGFIDLYLLPLIFGGVGLVQVAVGVPLFLNGRRASRRRAWLLEHGRETWADAFEVEKVRNVRINNRNPYVIRATWQDPATGQTHETTSDYLMRHPGGQFGEGARVRVLFNPERPDDHSMVALDGSQPTG